MNLLNLSESPTMKFLFLLVFSAEAYVVPEPGKIVRACSALHIIRATDAARATHLMR